MYQPESNFKYILSIDVGIKNLALVLIEHTNDYSFKDIVWFDLIDITKHVHLDKESEKNCELYHSKTITDWLTHIMYLHTELFNFVEHIIIERQPPNGHVAIEQLFFFKYRTKSILISPRSVHKFFGWSKNITYEQRKEKSIEILKYKLSKSQRPWLLEELTKLKRIHDISDASIQGIYFLYKKHEKYITEKNLENIYKNSEFPLLENFRFIPKIEEF